MSRSKTILPDVSSPAGAPMGRVPKHGDPEAVQRFSLQRVRLNAGGYDVGGAYWGHGKAALYYVASEDGETDYFIRARDRDEAKEQVRFSYPYARFWR